MPSFPPPPPPANANAANGYTPQQQAHQQSSFSSSVAPRLVAPSLQPPLLSAHNNRFPPPPPPPLSGGSTGALLMTPPSNLQTSTGIRRPPPPPVNSGPPLLASRGARQPPMPPQYTVPPPSVHHHMPPVSRDPFAHMQPPSSRVPPVSQSQNHPPSHSHMPPPPPSAQSQNYLSAQNQMNSPSHSHMAPLPQSHMLYPSASSAVPNPSTTHRMPPPQSPNPYNNDTTIDSSQIPRPVIESSSSPYYPRAQMGQAPPLPQHSTVVDDGNAAPAILRSTVYQFPATRAQWHATGDIPLALQCMPLAVPSQDFVSPPRLGPDGHIVSNDETTPAFIPMLPITDSPPRCTNCFAYANPFATDTKCIFCGTASSSSSLLTARPEATVEWEVAGPYLTRATPVQPVQLYVLDLTCPHVEEYKSLLVQLGRDMTDHCQQQQQQMSRVVSRMGVCFVSSLGILIPQQNAASGHVSWMVVADVTEDPFVPVPLEEWTFVMNESADAWTQFIEQLDIKSWRKQAFARNAYGLDGSELSCGGAALMFLSHALALSGGRGTLLTWRRPNFGVGGLTFREESQALLLGRSNVENVMTYVPVQVQSKPKGKEDEAAAPFYMQLAEECIKNRVTLDVVMHTGSVSSNSFLGLASLGELCRVTSGSLYWLQALNWEESLYHELRNNLRAFTGWDAIFKVRCSAGVQIRPFLYPPGKSRDGPLGDSPELELSSLSPHTCISVELDHRVGGIPKTNKVVYFQTALLYTSLSGRRLIRVSTLAIPVAQSVHDVFQGADFSAILPYLVRTTYTHLLKSIYEQQQSKKDETNVARQKTRDALYAQCVNLLVHYRQNTPAISIPTGQLSLPPRLQLLPLFCMCLLKRPMLVPGFPCRDQSLAGARIQPSGDERAYFNFHLLKSNPTSCMSLMHPNIYSVDLNSRQNDGELSHVVIPMPPMVRPSMESFHDNGMYIIDDGLRAFLYMGRLVPDATKQAWIERRDDALMGWLWRLQTNRRPNCPAVIPVLQQSDHQGLRETEILSLMVEDASPGEKDYVAFLTKMHHEIRNRLQSKRK